MFLDIPLIVIQLFKSIGTLLATREFSEMHTSSRCRWRGGDSSEAHSSAMLDLAYAFGFTLSATSLTHDQAGEVVKALSGAFCGRGGDLLLVLQNVEDASAPVNDSAYEGMA